MRKIKFLHLIAAIAILLTGSAQSDVTFRIDPDTLCRGFTNTVITFSMDNPYDVVGGMMADILFDTDCFTVTDIEKTIRSAVASYFAYKDIDGGITIFMTPTLASQFDPGSGPMAYIFVDTNNDCLNNEYLWEVDNALVEHIMGVLLPVIEVDGLLTVNDCDPCTIDVSETEVTMDTVFIGRSVTAPITVTNTGPTPRDIFAYSEGCASVDLDKFFLDTGHTKEIHISSKISEPGICYGTVTLSGCEDVAIHVTCHAQYADTIFLSMNDRTFLTNSEGNRLPIYLRNTSKLSNLYVRVTYDTTCFEVTAVEKTERSQCPTFRFWEISEGIEIKISYPYFRIPAGSGPIADIFFNVKECTSGKYPWDITPLTARDDIGRVMFTMVDDGLISVAPIFKGDINDNGIVDIIDIVFGVRIILGLHPDPTPGELEAADCNMDDEINILDILGIVNVILELSTCPP